MANNHAEIEQRLGGELDAEEPEIEIAEPLVKATQ